MKNYDESTLVKQFDQLRKQFIKEDRELKDRYYQQFQKILEQIKTLREEK